MIKILDHFEDTESKTVFNSGPLFSDPRSSRDAPRLWRELDGHDGRLLSLSRRLRGKIWQSSDMKTRNFCVAGKRCWLQSWRLFWWRHRRRRRREADVVDAVLLLSVDLFRRWNNCGGAVLDKKKILWLWTPQSKKDSLKTTKRSTKNYFSKKILNERTCKAFI